MEFHHVFAGFAKMRLNWDIQWENWTVLSLMPDMISMNKQLKATQKLFWL